MQRFTRKTRVTGKTAEIHERPKKIYPTKFMPSDGLSRLVQNGGVQVNLTSFVFFSPQLILQKSNGSFQRKLSFFKVPEGVQHFPVGVQLFPGGGGGGGGSNCLFPIETQIPCDFPGGS